MELRVSEHAEQLGIDTCIEIDTRLLVPERRIRELCYEDRCGNYRKHYMCPPHVGSLRDIEARLRKYERGFLLQYTQPLDVRNDREGVIRAKIAFHRKILELEKFLKSEGVRDVWGMMGGNCALCEICKAAIDEPCPYPDEARTSLESLAIDVLALLDNYGLDSEFHADKIVWTGCILFSSSET